MRQRVLCEGSASLFDRLHYYRGLALNLVRRTRKCVPTDGRSGGPRNLQDGKLFPSAGWHAQRVQSCDGNL